MLNYYKIHFWSISVNQKKVSESGKQLLNRKIETSKNNSKNDSKNLLKNGC